MKKIFIISLFLLPFISFAQSDDHDYTRRNELKANAFNLIVLKAVDFSYEYLIDAKSSVGISFFFNLKDDKISDFEETFDLYYHEKQAFTPFYRRYISSKHAWGFFLEAFGMYNKQRNSIEERTEMEPMNIKVMGTSNNFALGITAGGKIVVNNGLAFEFYGGVGRNIYTSNSDFSTEIVPRLGASIGYRF
ncbi:DUF3575 domain-containing protein [Aureibaculum sp. 2210JD6-5]|uniref:DUF3575 domain-containing protein n=1 Tax=Aureibaculum sp. 2210JD6-5 TaxID=3103957 RepID=UPI002AAC6A21|nr:DUF3575 domain-containing protein [Aureibaculum sp. 2210JD6-5]MDY7394150.1 DUF3575 domain-containing protein [Aureibaculum sp. 2210JD6-5]